MAHPGLSHARVLRIALPIVLSNATVPLLGAVDTAVVGQMGLSAPIGAVGLGAVVLASVYWIFGFLRMGTSGLMAQARGAGDPGEASAVLVRALMIGAAGGLLLVLMQGPLMAFALRLAPGSAEVERLARQYLAIRIWGAPATICLYAVTGGLIAAERTRAVLVIQLWMNGLNIGLDLWFVLGLGWGVPGVATATLIAEWSGLAVGLWYCRDVWPVDRARLADLARLARMVAVNGDILLRTVVLQGSFTAFVFLGAGFGDVTLAANQVLMQFLQITAYGLDGFAFASEALVGQAVGARSRERFWRSIRLTSFWAAVVGVTCAVIIWLTGPWLIDLMSVNPEVRETARRFLPWCVLTPILGAASFQFDGIYSGAMATKEMRNMMIVSLAIFLAAWWLLETRFGNHGLWAALNIFFVARGLTFASRMPSLERRAFQAL